MPPHCTQRTRREHCRPSLKSHEDSELGSITAVINVHVLMRDERRKEERSKQDQTNNKAKQHSTPKAVTFPKKNELPQAATGHKLDQYS